jgi:predicted nucleotide-binding protein
MAKLSGIQKALIATNNEKVSALRNAARMRETHPPDQVGHYFIQAATHVETLKRLLPDLYGDFHPIQIAPETAMLALGRAGANVMHYSRSQVERLIRDIDQIFEIRANSELEQPKQEALRRVFITHGRSDDWRAVQAFVEKDVRLPTIELAQEPNLGRTIIEKLEDSAARCDSAVIVMTGDDVANEDESRVRENVMHEIGFFQGRYGRTGVVLMHEEGVNIPTNLSGVVYVPFPNGSIEAVFHVLQRELNAIYKIR